jgi:hypothetical protein
MSSTNRIPSAVAAPGLRRNVVLTKNDSEASSKPVAAQGSSGKSSANSTSAPSTSTAACRKFAIYAGRDRIGQIEVADDGVPPMTILDEVIEINRQTARRREESKRATRLSENWQPTNNDLSFARERGLDGPALADEILKFRNYWTAKSQDATKLDWGATWRNWVLRALELGHGRPYRRGGGRSNDPPTRLASTGANAILAGMGNLARRLDQGRGPARPSQQQI